MRMARNVYHRHDGRFEGRYANGHTIEGKTKYGSVFGKTYAECKEKLEKARSNVMAAVPLAEPQTLRNAVTTYIETAKKQIKPSTLGVYRRYLESYISPHFGNALCSAFTLETAQGFIDKLIENGFAARTVQSVFSLLQVSVQSVNGGVFKVKYPKRHRDDVSFFTMEEQKRLESATKASRFMDYIALYTGLRIGELCGLQWVDIDLERGSLCVNRTMQRIPNTNGDTKTQIVFLAPKSVASERVIPLPDFLVELLRELKADRNNGFVIAIDNRPVEPRTLQYRFKKICVAADVGDVNFHTTRHTFCVRALENGFDIKSLSEIMGHASAIVTLTRYAHATDVRKRTCMNALSAVYSES
ncbi:site-specific integrase [Clostridia bacterium]|nr:site-specific integrase [Clostridia bacterium]